MDWASHIGQIKGGYIRPDNGGACLPLIHHETGEIMGWQVRVQGQTPQFSKGVMVRDAAPLYRAGASDRAMVLVLEGPSDFATVAALDDGHELALIGVWSAGIMPPAAWLSKNIPAGTCVVTCGDGDAAGEALPQLFADRAQRPVHVVKMAKGADARDVIEKDGWGRFTAMIGRAVLADPMKPHKPAKRKSNYRDNPNPSSVRIEDLLTAAGARLASKLSTGQLKYRCPLHEDRKNPSLTADPATDSWKCWSGCGQGGPAQFVMAWRGCSYEAAREYLARIA